MIWNSTKNKALSVVFLLAVGGCATTSPENLKKSQAPATPNIAVVVTGETPSVLITPSSPTDSEKTDDLTVAPTAKKDYPDIWTRLRAGFAMKALDSPQVERELQWFVNNPEYMQRMMERARLYLYYITDEVEKRGMPMEIALLPAIESAYKPHAYSRARAVGLWQFMPATGRLYGLQANWWYDGRRDVEASTKAALDYLEKLYNDFDGDWHLALAAYNAGEGKVGRMIEYNRRKGKSTDYQYLKLKRETLNYVPKLMAMANIVSNPDKYGVKLASIPNAPYFTRVETGYQVDLGVVAKLVDLSVDDLHNINPGYTRWATDPKGPHYLLVPIDKKDALVAGLSNLPENERIQWLHHAVKRGETISEISRRYGLSIEALRTANNLRTNLLRTGQDLMIPYSARAMTPPVVHAAYRNPSARVAQNGDPVIHRVRNGETLTSIARRYNVLVRQVINWNLIEADDVLRMGQKLKIWTRGGPTASLGTSTLNS